MNTSTPSPAARPRRIKRIQAGALARREWVFRFAIVILVVGAVALAWWSLMMRLLPLQKQARALSVNVSQVSSEVDALDRKWPKSLEQAVTGRFGQARSRLFTNQAALETWLTGLRQEANPLVLQSKTDFGKNFHPETNDLQLAVIPATVSLDVRPMLSADGKGSPYERLLRFGQTLTVQAKRADLSELTVTGGTNSITSATLVFGLWASEEGKP